MHSLKYVPIKVNISIINGLHDNGYKHFSSICLLCILFKFLIIPAYIGRKKRIKHYRVSNRITNLYFII